MEYYQKNYYNYEYWTHWVLHDYQWVLCASLYIAMQKWATQQDLDGEDVFFHLDSLWDWDCLFENKNSDIFIHETFTWELSTIYYQNKYPWFKKNFDNPLEYFTPYNANIWQWVMFANVPNIPKYHQLLKIRAALKKFHGLAQLCTEQTRQTAIKYCINWVIWQVPRFLELRNKEEKLFISHNPSITLEKLAEREVQLKKHIQMLLDSTPIFKQMCEAYLEMFEHPFYLLEEMYREIAKERGVVVPNGREYLDIDICKQMVDEQMAK